MERESEGVGDIGGAGQSVAREGALEVFDRVLRLSARTVERLVDGARLHVLHGGDDEARIGLVREVLGLHDDPPLVRPASCRVPEGPEPTRRLTGGVSFVGRFFHPSA